MADDITPRDSGEEQPADSAPKKDPYLDVLRDLPRLRSAERDPDSKPYTPPAPTMLRIGAFAQGCSSFLLLMVGTPMLIVALSFGFHVWGPGLLMSIALILMFGVRGLWRGRRAPLVIGILGLGAAMVIAFVWQYFLLAVSVLSPFDSSSAGGSLINMAYEMGIRIGIMVLLLTLGLHVVSLISWRKLHSPTRNALIAWGSVIAVLVVLPLLLQLRIQAQRQSWLEDHRDSWQEDEGLDRLILGANTEFSLGYTPITEEDDLAERLDVRKAEFQAILDSGASPVRLSANGDILLEQHVPRLYIERDDQNKPENQPTEVADGSGSLPSDIEEKINNQLDYERQYMETVQESGVDLFISDSQYSTYLLLKARDEDEKTGWGEFTQLHEERIRYYARQYQPAYYGVLTEPGAYEDFSGLEMLAESEEERLDAWVAHTEDLIEAVHEESPDTRVAVTISLDRDFDLKYYERVLGLEGLDIITVDAYQQVSFEKIEDLVDEHGHPRDHGQELWITDTWYGFCMTPQRSMKLDSLWLETVVAFAAKEQITGVLPTSFGCFLQPGGTLINPVVDLDGRTEVFETWKDLVGQWQVARTEDEEDAS